MAALNRAMKAFAPPSDPDALDPGYPPNITPQDRVDHVLKNEYPDWRSIPWLAAAADTEPKQARSVIRERLADGTIELSTDSVRRNRYHIHPPNGPDQTQLHPVGATTTKTPDSRTTNGATDQMEALVVSPALYPDHP